MNVLNPASDSRDRKPSWYKKKNTQNETERIKTILNYITENYQISNRTHAYVYGSSKTVQNEGGGILLNLENGEKKTQSEAAGQF